VVTAAQVIVLAMADSPATPRPAATIILLRRSGRHAERGVEVLLAQRSLEASFMPGVWVFPGGIVEPGENPVETARRELGEEVGIELGAEAELVPWSRWITPEVVPVRFDTHFFVALAPPHSPPKPDGAEITEASWFAPGRALESHRAGELSLVFPTIRNLEALGEHPTADAVMATARETVVEPILPRVAGTRDDHRVLLPGDEGYDEAAPDVDRLPS
jgi:8-oxo-dGTP pyrophosphatase MutT (NUDIX family)